MNSESSTRSQGKSEPGWPGARCLRALMTTNGFDNLLEAAWSHAPLQIKQRPLTGRWRLLANLAPPTYPVHRSLSRGAQRSVGQLRLNGTSCSALRQTDCRLCAALFSMHYTVSGSTAPAFLGHRIVREDHASLT